MGWSVGACATGWFTGARYRIGRRHSWRRWNRAVAVLISSLERRRSCFARSRSHSGRCVTECRVVLAVRNATDSVPQVLANSRGSCPNWRCLHTTRFGAWSNIVKSSIRNKLTSYVKRGVCLTFPTFVLAKHDDATDRRSLGDTALSVRGSTFSSQNREASTLCSISSIDDLARMRCHAQLWLLRVRACSMQELLSKV
jgi:hypothetical protein